MHNKNESVIIEYDPFVPIRSSSKRSMTFRSRKVIQRQNVRSQGMRANVVPRQFIGYPTDFVLNGNMSLQ